MYVVFSSILIDWKAHTKTKCRQKKNEIQNIKKNQLKVHNINSTTRLISLIGINLKTCII